MTATRAAARAAAALLLVGCSREAAPRAAPATTAPAPSATASAPPTSTPTATPSATATPSPVPTASPATAVPPAGATDYAFPIAGCRVSYGRTHHDYPATDVFAREGCAFVSPVRGRVDEVTYVDRWSAATNRGEDRGGLSVSVVGVDGVRYYGSHLSRIAPGIKPGVRVEAGARLGDVGDTGSARGTSPHLHFGLSWPSRPGIWWVRRGVVPPARYLDSWRAGGDLSPAAEVAAARRRAGTDAPPCRVYC
ncbi:MAG TPA: M23 family metallopeptidase [Mycobacteriales bacterium]|jgi:murein DD-endopeptidase MepM/ murein hydrolase activator NlpD